MLGEYVNIDGVPEIVKNEKVTLAVLLYELTKLILDVLVRIELGVVDKVILLEII